MTALPPATPVPPRRWGLRLLGVVLLLLAMAWATPILVGYTPAVGWACGLARDYVDGSVTVGAASLGWFSPIVLYDVELRDAAGRPVIHVPRLETSRTLLSLLMDYEDLGKIRLERPKLEWNFAGNDSNLERLFAKSLHLSEAATPGTDAPLAKMPFVQLEVVDGTIAVFDDDSKLFWKAHSLTLSAITFNDPARTAQINVQGALHDGGEAGSLKAEVQIQNTASANPKATIKGRFASFPLAMTNVFARRFSPGANLSGSLQGHCLMSATLKDGQPIVDFVGEMTVNHVHVSTPLLADQVFIERLNAPCRFLLDGRKLTIERAELAGDFGKANLQGTFDLDRDGVAMLDRPDFNLSANVNLAVLAERLPKTLRMHHDIRVMTGQIDVTCKSVAQGDAVVWQGNLHASDIRGIRGTQTIAWSDPIRFDVKARNLSKGVPLIDELKCTARFLKLDASVAADQFALTAEADLDQLAEPLGQFIDIDALRLSGRATARIGAKRQNDRFELIGDAQLKQVKLTWLTSQPWREDAASAKFGAIGRLDRAGKQSIESGQLEARLGSDLIVLELKDAIPNVAAGPWGSLAVRVEGDLTRWRQRARGWTTLLDGWYLEGQASMTAQVRPSPSLVECASINVQATNFHGVGPALWIHEPSLILTSSARWDTRSQRIDLGPTKLACATAQLETANLSLDPTNKMLQTSIHVTGDIATLRKWTQNPKARPGEPIEGALDARLDLQAKGSRVTSDVQASIKNVVVGSRARPTWQEAEVTCALRGTYDLDTDSAQLDKLRLAGATIAADLKGAIAGVTSVADLTLDGTLTYDLEKMEPQLRPYLGKDVKIVGKDSRPIHVAGPLYPKTGAADAAMRFTALKGQAALDWRSLKAYGCDVGPAEVKAVLQQGWFQLYPIEASVNGGKLRLQPNLRLDPEPVELVLLAGPVLDKARITPEMCAGGLGYAMPLLANVATAEGTISLSLEGGRIPLAAPATGEVKGKFVLHAGKVGPGPVVRELSGLLRVPPPTSLIKESQVPFHMVAGKVHHSGLELAFPEFTLKSSGAVGLDGTLALVIETPIPPAIVASAKLTPAQAKQLLRIPVGGTLDHPRPDPRALESLAGILGRSFLENQLNRLLQPKR